MLTHYQGPMQPGQSPTIVTDVVVVGAGPVGLFQVFQLGLLGLGCHLVDALPHVGGQCIELYPDKPIYDLPGIASATGRSAIKSLVKQIQPFVYPGEDASKTQAVHFHLGQLVQGLQCQANGRFMLETSRGQTFDTSALVIAAGVGAFLPKRPALDGLDDLQGHQVFYHPPPTPVVAGQSLLIQGDDDHAIAYALALSRLDHNQPSRIAVMHRRKVLTATADLQAEFWAACDAGAIDFVVGQPIELLSDAQNLLHAIRVSHPDGGESRHSATVYVPMLGLSPKLGPLTTWGLAMDKKSLPVNPATSETSQAGVYAVGDINDYPGKRKLIVCGYHEATMAAYAIAEKKLGHKMQVQYTTASKELHARLGV